MLKNNFEHWFSKDANLDNKEAMETFETHSQLQLPNSYKEMVRFRDGGTMDNYFFRYESDGISDSSFPGLFLCWQKNTLGCEYILDEPPEGLPQGLIPFARDGGGNYTCFDYRNCRQDPPIVFWHHGFEEGKDVFYLADSFEEFINGLKSEGEIEHAT